MRGALCWRPYPSGVRISQEPFSLPCVHRIAQDDARTGSLQRARCAPSVFHKILEERFQLPMHSTLPLPPGK